jgi:alpha-glucosidase (family GH31 glycosyl hydrolase)
VPAPPPDASTTIDASMPTSGATADGSTPPATDSAEMPADSEPTDSDNSPTDSAAGGEEGPAPPAPATCQSTGVAVPAGERVGNGQPLVPPKWAFGVLWGSYYDQVGPPTAGSVGNLLDAERQLRSDAYGGDLMWIDSSWLYHSYGGASAGAAYVCFQFDPTTFPNPGSMISTLRTDHFHFGVWEWPWMGHGCQYFNTAVTNRYFVMNGTTPALATGGWHGDPTPAAFDFTSSAAVSWWIGLNKPLTDWGLDFMKLDTGGDAPAGGQLADATKVYRTEYHRAAFDVTRAFAASTNPDARMNGARGFILTHTSTTPGNDQFPGMWTDDTDSTWAGFAGQDLTRARNLNTTSSAAFWCGDTGGYGINTAAPTDELYIRWLEYSSFTPCQEIFGSKSVGSRFPWRYSNQAQAIAKEYLALRYRLLPFRYSNFQRTYHEKPTTYPVTFASATQILVGQAPNQLLVQAVTNPGVTSMAVNLPAGSSWVDYWTGTIYPGGAAATVPAPIDQEPVFVRLGSIIPMGPPLQWVDQVPADPLTLDIYPAGPITYTLYEDDGISEGYLGGAYSTTTFSADDTSGSLVVTIDPQVTARYPYSGQLCSRTYILKANQQKTAPTAVMRDGRVVPAATSATFQNVAEGWYYDAASATTWVKFGLSSLMGTKVTL